jgi:hypothetical protein
MVAFTNTVSDPGTMAFGKIRKVANVSTSEEGKAGSPRKSTT